MSQRLAKSAAAVIAVALALAAAVTVNAVFQGPGSGKILPSNPWEGKSDAERQTDVDAAHKRNDDYLRAFVAQGLDPRSLPVIEIDAYAAPLDTEDASTARADLIVRGRVKSTTFSPNPSGGMPISISNVIVSRTEKGQVSESVNARQLAGPVAQANGGALVHLHNDEPLLPGDDVILLLEKADDGTMVTQPGTGIYFVRNGITIAEDTNPFGAQLSGRSAEELMQSLSTSAARTAAE